MEEGSPPSGSKREVMAWGVCGVSNEYLTDSQTWPPVIKSTLTLLDQIYAIFSEWNLLTLMLNQLAYNGNLLPFLFGWLHSSPLDYFMLTSSKASDFEFDTKIGHKIACEEKNFSN